MCFFTGNAITLVIFAASLCVPIFGDADRDDRDILPVNRNADSVNRNSYSVNRSSDHGAGSSFEEFVLRFAKKYGSQREYDERFAVYQASLRRHEWLNAAASARHNGSRWRPRYGVTRFSDLTPQEFREMFLLGTKGPPVHSGASAPPGPHVQLSSLPTHFDWRDKRAVTAVKNQESCGGCWAFASVQVVESASVLTGGLLKPLSVQQVLDCSRVNHGCQGGDTVTAFSWLNKTRLHLVLESLYPFTNSAGPCRIFTNSTPGVEIKDFASHSFRDDEEAMMGWLVGRGPLAVSVDAVSWQDYLGGVVQHHCSSSTPNHAGTLTGYSLGDLPYWIVRNSWGPEWGLDGYIYIKMFENMCGIANEVATVTV
ncbi:LOW QUALITY PROTEIN: cathepsin O [Lampetra planeri]